MWLSEQDHNFTLCGIRKVGFDQMNGMDVYNFLHMVISAGRINYNPACLGEEVDLMEIESNLILLGKK